MTTNRITNPTSPSQIPNEVVAPNTITAKDRAALPTVGTGTGAEAGSGNGSPQTPGTTTTNPAGGTEPLRANESALTTGSPTTPSTPLMNIKGASPALTRGTTKGALDTILNRTATTTEANPPNVTQAVTDTVTAAQREAAQADMDANPTLIQALSVANLYPDAEGVVRVQNAANTNPNAWQNVLDAAATVVATGGTSDAANKALGTAMASFMKTSGLRATDTADMAYLLARAMLKNDSLERDDTMAALQAALDQAKARLADLQQQRTDTANNAVAPPSNDGGGGKKDDSSDNSAAQQQYAVQEKQREQQLQSLDEQIKNQNQLVSQLSQSIANGKGGDQQQNNQMVTEAILAMAEQANIIAAMSAGMTGDPASPGGQSRLKVLT